MNLKDTLLERYDSSKIDPAAITLHTLDNRNVRLPYTGPLPVQFEGAANPCIFMSVRPGDVRVVLCANKGSKKLRANIEATSEEIDNILFRFFFEHKGNNAYHTRFDNGLDRYWLGLWTAHYEDWRLTAK